MATGGQRVMWCGYWPISRQYGDVMPSSSHGKMRHEIHLYSQCLTMACVTVTQQLLVCSVGICPTDESHHRRCREQLWGAPSTDTSGHRSSCTQNADIETLRPVCEYMFICHTLCVNCNVHMCVSMLFYMYPHTSLSEQHGCSRCLCLLPQEWYSRQSLCSCPGLLARLQARLGTSVPFDPG